MSREFGAIRDRFQSMRDVFGVKKWAHTYIFVLKLHVFRVIFAKFVIFDGRARFREASLGAKITGKLGFRGCRCRVSSGRFAIASKVCGMCLGSKIRRIRVCLC